MAVRIYRDRKTKEPVLNPKTGQPFWEAYWNQRSTMFPDIRVQRNKVCDTEAEAKKAERALIKEASQEVARREAKGTCWKAVIDYWASEAKQEDGSYRNPVTGKSITEKSVVNFSNMLRSWTAEWLEIPASQLNRGHGKDVLRKAEDAELSRSSIKKIKNTINIIYNFGIEEGIIKGVQHSPVHGLLVNVPSEEKLPEILTVKEVQKLLFEARVSNHPWYKVWSLALTTGMRSSELYALRKKNVDLKSGLIRICESWDWLTGEAKKTKAGYWRNAPISPPMRELIETCMSENPSSEYLLPRLNQWERGNQAQVLRSFCERIGVSSIRFHALRACFATHLLGSGVDEATVMRIGGWKDFKTFQIYVRLAGIREQGATDDLSKLILPDDKKVFEHIGSHYMKDAA